MITTGIDPYKPATIGQMRVKNRIIMGGMHTGLEDQPNAARNIAAFYAARAAGGVGLIITGGVAPSVDGGGPGPMARLIDDDSVPHHRIVTDAVHAAGGKILLQILHIGGWGGPEPLFVNSYSDQQIEQTISNYGRCAALAIKAGYDGVEIIGSGTYLINQFLCLRTNKRSDRWGGSLENRMRLAMHIVRTTRKALGPEPALSFRISLMDFVQGGALWQDVVATAQQLETLGVDLLNATIGGHDTPIPTIAATVPRSAFVWLSKALKNQVSIPVTATNRINTPDQIKTIIARGTADFVALARPFLADPQFVAKSQAGQDTLINTCIACNQTCLDKIFTGAVASCLVNPKACRETEFANPPAQPNTTNLAVVGAGPGGMAAAIYAAEQGRKVTLFEQSGDIGGQLNLAKQVPGKTEFFEMLRYFRTRLDQLSVTVRLHHTPTPNDLKSFQDVLIATGVKPRPLAVPWAAYPGVLSYLDVLTGRPDVGKRVAIIGSGGIGFDVAEYLCATQTPSIAAFDTEWGIDPHLRRPGGVLPPRVNKGSHPRPAPKRQIFILQRGAGQIGPRLGKTTGWIKRKQLKHQNVSMLAGVTCLGFSNRKLQIDVLGTLQVLDIDTVINCTGQETYDPYRDLATRDGGPRIRRIGGARDAAGLSAERAIREALQAVWS